MTIDYLKLQNKSMELSPMERAELYNKLSRKIDRVGFPNNRYNQKQRSLFVANCKLIVRILVDLTDKSYTACYNLTELNSLTDLNKKYISQCIAFLNEEGVIQKMNRNCVSLESTSNNNVVSILDVYKLILRNEAERQ